MDTILHITQGALITSYATDNPYLIGAGGLIGGLPDIIGFAEKLIKKDSWNWYNYVHSVSFKNPLMYLPVSLIHILLDKPLHTKGCKWWKFPCLWVEIGLWVITLILILVRYN